MSINVTVTGNPVRINRGKMVTACPCKDAQKGEFEKRRLMRLEQVRQQSREIAENVRNKVRKEKEKQCCSFERENEKKLKDWQARKLLELHNQYQESLKNIGLGHKEAEIIDIIEEDIVTQKKCCERIAAERGSMARQRLEQQNLKCSSAPIQQKKHGRDIGKVRTEVVHHRGTCGDKCWCASNKKRQFYTVVGSTESADESPIQVSLRTGSGSHSVSSSGYYGGYKQHSPSIDEISKPIISDKPGTATAGKSRNINAEIETKAASGRRKFSSELRKDRNTAEISEETCSSGSPKRFTSQLTDISEVSGGSTPRGLALSSETDRDIVDSSDASDSGEFGADVTEAQRNLDSQLRRDLTNLSENEPGETLEALPNGGQTRKFSLQKITNAPEGRGRRGISGSQRKATVEGFAETRTKRVSRETTAEDKPKRTVMDRRKDKTSEEILENQQRRGFVSKMSEKQELSNDQRRRSVSKISENEEPPNDQLDSQLGGDKGTSSGQRKKFGSQIKESRRFSDGQQRDVRSQMNEDRVISSNQRKGLSSQVISHQEVSGSKRKPFDSEIDENEGIVDDFQGFSESRPKENSFDPQYEKHEVKQDFIEDRVRKSTTQFQKGKTVEAISETGKGRKKIASGSQRGWDIGESSEISEQRRKASAGSILEKEFVKNSEAFMDRKSNKISATGGKDTDGEIITVQETSEKYTKRDLLSDDQSSPQRLLEKTIRTSKTIQYPVETRISDRIKHRSTTVASDLCDTLPEEPTRPIIRSNPDLQKQVSSRIAQKQDFVAQIKPATADKEINTLDIPEKSELIKLKDKRTSMEDVTSAVASSSCHRTTCPDYQKHAKRYLQTKSKVSRVNEEQLEMVINYENEDEYLKKMERQDREAEERGRQALQKEKTKRDYEDMMKKLPVVQKQERLSRICSNKPEYHMSEHRLKEIEERRQFQMESAFENAFPSLKPNIITVPRTQGTSPVEVENEPFRVVSTAQKTCGISVGIWDVSKKGDADAMVDESCDCCSTENQTKRERQLRELLLNLQAQKELLLKEVNTLPKDSQLNELLGSLHDISTKKKSKKISSTELCDRNKMEKKRSLHDSLNSSNSSTTTPRKKSKCKCVLICQNTSTQTSPITKSDAQVGDSVLCRSIEKSNSPPKSPKVASKSTSPRQPHICAASGEICECETSISNEKSKPAPLQTTTQTATNDEKVPKGSNKICDLDDDKVCEIVIKIRENESQPEIIVNPVEKSNKQIDIAPNKITITDKKPEKYNTKFKSVDAISIPYQPKMSSTWREQFSQTTTNYSSSSTSYYSPPDVTLFEKKVCKHSKVDSRQPRLRDVLHEKRKQTNLASCCTGTPTPCSSTQTARKMHPFITKYIEKLLTMSRSTIDDLSVSSVSDVTTPSSSIIEVSSNVPMVHLKKLLKRLGISYDELREMYGKSGKHESVLSSLPSSSSTNSASDEILEHRVNNNCPCAMQDETTNTCLSVTPKISTANVSEEDDENYHQMMSKYAEITESCNKKISNLTAMIEKVRSEKEQIMSNPDSSGTNERENTTTIYLEPPHGDTTSDSSAAEQEKLDKLLLAIDESFAENLKAMTSGEIREKYGTARVEFSREEISDDSVSDIRKRYRQLMTVDEAHVEPFVPLLQDIPKLPILTEPLICESLKCPNKRPPPSKGLTVAKRFNEDITGVPHELSTIIEGDSQVSTKALKSNEGLSASVEVSHRSTETSTPDILREISTNFRQETKINPQSSEESSDKREVVFDKDVLVQQLSSSSSEDLESLEKMLREMGMGWAIVTLRKTQEALALASSSSSLDINIQQTDIQMTDVSPSTSEISLKGVLSRHLLTKISSASTTSSETSISLLMKEFEDISAILGSGSTTKEGRRTSTPIHPVPDRSRNCTCNRSGSGSDGDRTKCAFHNLHRNDVVMK